MKYLLLTLLMTGCVTVNTYKQEPKPEPSTQCLEHNNPVYCHGVE